MEFQNFIFDLDGTLFDSLLGIETSLRFAIEECLPNQPLPELRNVIGPPVPVMLRQLWPQLDEEKLGQIVAAFRKHYDKFGCRLSVAYPEVVDTLARLRAAQRCLFVLTNKPTHATEVILRENNLRACFSEVVSPDKVKPAFPSKTAAAKALFRDRHLLADKTLIIGDGKDDAAAAAECGCKFVMAAYGYGYGAIPRSVTPFKTLKSFGEILSLVHIPAL